MISPGMGARYVHGYHLSTQLASRVVLPPHMLRHSGVFGGGMILPTLPITGLEDTVSNVCIRLMLSWWQFAVLMWKVVSTAEHHLTTVNEIQELAVPFPSPSCVF